MQPKSKKAGKKEEVLFTEEERNSIPFVRTVSNKMRNNNKKLSDIAELEAKPAEQLKPEQKEKISKKQQIVEENQRFEEVLRLYKSIENDRKDNELSEADKTIHLMTLVGVLAEQPEVLIEKKIVTKDEIKFFEPLVSLRKKHACTKDALQQTKLFVKDYLKNDGLQGIVEKTIAHKDFAAIEWKHGHHHEEKQTSKPKPKETKTEEKQTTEAKTITVQEPAVCIPKIEPKEEVLTTTSNPPPTTEAAKPPEAIPSVAEKQEVPKPTEAETTGSQPNANSETQNSTENSSPQPYRKRSRGAEQWPVVHRDSGDDGRFTREERAQLDKDGFTVVEKPQKVKSKYSTKQFGPRRDNRQYHQ